MMYVNMHACIHVYWYTCTDYILIAEENNRKNVPEHEILSPTNENILWQSGIAASDGRASF